MGEHPAASFEASERRLDLEVVVVELAGELDFATVAAVEERLDRVIVAGCHALVVDLTRATLITSSVVNVLFAAIQRSRLVDAALTIACPEGSVRKVLELTSVDRAAPIFATTNEAVEAVTREIRET